MLHFKSKYLSLAFVSLKKPGFGGVAPHQLHRGCVFVLVCRFLVLIWAASMWLSGNRIEWSLGVCGAGNFCTWNPKAPTWGDTQSLISTQSQSCSGKGKGLWGVKHSEERQDKRKMLRRAGRLFLIELGRKWSSLWHNASDPPFLCTAGWGCTWSIVCPGITGKNNPSYLMLQGIKDHCQPLTEWQCKQQCSVRDVQ